MNGLRQESEGWSILAKRNSILIDQLVCVQKTKQLNNQYSVGKERFESEWMADSEIITIN